MAATLTAATLTAKTSNRITASKPVPGSVANSALAPLSLSEDLETSFTLAFGTGSGQANHVVRQDRQLAAGASETLDLFAGLTDIFGVASTGFTNLKYLKIEQVANPSGTNGSGLTIGNAAADQFVGWFGAAAHTHALEYGGMPYVAGSAGGKTVSNTVKNLKITNADGSNAITYRITAIGVAA